MKQIENESNPGKRKATKMIRFAIRIPETLKRRLDIHKGRRGIKLQDFGAAALAEKLDRDKGAAA